MKIIYFIQYLMFMIFFMPVAAMPYSMAVRLGRFFGIVLYVVAGKRRKVAVENIRRAMQKGAIEYDGTPEELAREVFRNLGQWFVEMVKVLFGFGRKLVDSVRVEGVENVHKVLESGRGVMLISGHCGNWELLALCLTSKIGRTMHGVARKQNNPYINKFIIKAREKQGSKIIYKEGVLRKLISLMRDGEVTGMLVDQHVSQSMGYVMDFLGSPAWVSRTPATIARKTGASLVPMQMSLTSEGHLLRFYPEVEVDDDLVGATRKLNDYIQGFIKEVPSQWLWIHRRWKKIPPEYKEKKAEE